MSPPPQGVAPRPPAPAAGDRGRRATAVGRSLPVFGVSPLLGGIISLRAVPQIPSHRLGGRRAATIAAAIAIGEARGVGFLLAMGPEGFGSPEQES